MNKSLFEEWRDVQSAPFLQASSLGRIRIAPYVSEMPNGGVREICGKPTFGDLTCKRFNVRIRGKNYKVRRLVCEAFNGPRPDGMICCHKDEDSRNNRPDNLEWNTQKHNLNAPGFIAYCRSRTGDDSSYRKGKAKARIVQEVPQHAN